MEKKMYTLNEICEMFRLKPSNVNYLKVERIIPSFRRGSGTPTLFPAEAVQIIKARLAKLNVER